MDLQALTESIRSSALARSLRAGAAIGVVQGGSTDVVPLGNGVHPSTPVEIGSLTKVFTALLLGQAIERGEVDLATRVDEALFGEQWTGTGASITAVDLATHFSGLPRLPLSMLGRLPLLVRDPYRTADRRSLLRYLKRKRPTKPAVATFTYSNLGFAVLGLLLERSAGMRYAEFLRERLLDPMSLASTHLALTGGPDLGTHGHSRSGRPSPAWHWDAYAPCGGLVSTLEDLLRAVGWLLKDGSFLAPARDRSMTPRSAVPGGSVGLAWFAPTGGAWSWHNGATFGHAAYLGVAPHRGVGVALVANQSLGAEITNLGHTLMRQMLA